MKNLVLRNPNRRLQALIFVSRVAGVFRAVLAHQPLRLRENDILLEYRVDIRSDVFRRSPTGRAVFHVLPILFCVLAFDIDDEPNNTGDDDANTEGRWDGSSAVYWKTRRQDRQSGARP